MKYILLLALISYGCGPGSGLVGEAGEITDTKHNLGYNLSDKVQEARKAVVYISVAGVAYGMHTDFELLRHYYGDPMSMILPKQRKRTGLGGTGFFIDLDNGYMVTNAHVVDGGNKRISVKLANGRSYRAQVKGLDRNTDIAVIKIQDEKFDRSDLGQLTLADSDLLRLGDFVFTLGAPIGLEMSISSGVVSGLNRGSLFGDLFADYIQIDASLNPGNSGGPLLSAQGEVIGINTASISAFTTLDNISFAIPSNIVRRVSEELIISGKFKWGDAGISWQKLTPELRDYMEIENYPELANGSGVLISSVNKNGPATANGLRPGDVVFAINSQPIKTPAKAKNTIGFTAPGSTVALKYIRSGKVRTAKVKVTLYDPRSKLPVLKVATNTAWKLQLGEINTNSLFYHTTGRGGLLVIKSQNLVSGIYSGDFIDTVDGKKVKTLKEFIAAIKDRNEVLLHVERQKGQYRFVTLTKG